MSSLNKKISQRRPIQISQGLALDEKNNTLKKRALCLCDDGTIWELVQGAWELLPTIPQTQYEVLVKSESEIK